MKLPARINILLIISSLTACTSHSPAPVDDLIYSQEKYRNSQTANNLAKQDKLNQINLHNVLRGETLFAIAWRYSLDYHSIAELNGLNSFRIYPGQKLILRKTDKRSVFNPHSLIAAINTDFLHKRKQQIILKNQSNSSQSNAVRTVQTSKQKPTTNSSNKTKQRKELGPRTSNSKIKNWIWPVNGKIVEGFSSKQNQNKGLDIKAKKGTAVRATAPGKVVYSGSGLKGYGQLVIIKHNDSYLSAYAHNNKIHVLENEVVKAGQRIADIGKSGADTFKLHFEIRYKGKPVNPLNYLPKAS